MQFPLGSVRTEVFINRNRELDEKTNRRVGKIRATLACSAFARRQRCPILPAQGPARTCAWCTTCAVIVMALWKIPVEQQIPIVTLLQVCVPAIRSKGWCWGGQVLYWLQESQQIRKAPPFDDLFYVHLLFFSYFFKLWRHIHNRKFTILTIFKCTVQWQ